MRYIFNILPFLLTSFNIPNLFILILRQNLTDFMPHPKFGVM